MAPALRLTPLITMITLLAACRSAPVAAPAPALPLPSAPLGTARDGRADLARRPDCIVLDSAQRIRRAAGVVMGARAPLPADSLARAGAGAVARRSDLYPEYDVVLDIPNLCVDRLTLAVDSLSARVELDARVANLLQIRAGADVRIGNVDLTIQGLQAQALLLVDLDDVVYMIDQTLTFVDKHPEVIKQLVGVTEAGARAAVGSGAASRGLILRRMSIADGQSILRTVSETGQLIEFTVSPSGQVVAERVVGGVLDLPIVHETAAASTADRVIRQVRDQTTGAVIEFALDRAGNRVSSVRIIAPPPDPATPRSL